MPEHDFAGLDRELDTVSCEHHDDAEIIGKARAALRAADEMKRENVALLYEIKARDRIATANGELIAANKQLQAELARQKQLLETTVRDQCETETYIENAVAAQIGPRRIDSDGAEPIDAFVERGMAELGRLRERLNRQGLLDSWVRGATRAGASREE